MLDILKILSLVFLLWLGAAFYSSAQLLCAADKETIQTRAELRLTPETLARGIKLAIRYLEKDCQANGKFIYRRNLDPQKTYPEKYNLLRHAGAMYALGMYYQRSPDPTTRAALQRAGKYLRDFIAPVKKYPGVFAVWSHPQSSWKVGGNDPTVAKLGAVGLSLIGLVYLEKAAPSSTPKNMLRGLGEFILAAQKNTGEFNTKFFLGQGFNNEFVSLYYPGEAILGLLLLHDLYPNPRWLRGAEKGLLYLASIRNNPQTIPPDHWALIATEKILAKLSRQKGKAEVIVKIRKHAAMIARLIMSTQSIQPTDKELNGAFYGDLHLRQARTCPASTRLEGLLATVGSFPKTAALQTSLRTAVDAGVLFLLRWQQRTGAMAGAIPFGTTPTPHIRNRQDLKYMERLHEVRIDYVQHAACAMMRYEACIFNSVPNPPPAATKQVSVYGPPSK